LISLYHYFDYKENKPLDECIKEYILYGINLRRKSLNVITVTNVEIGILGTTNYTLSDNEINIFELYIKFNNSKNNFDYFYNGKQLLP
jgi:hypothetical protein